MNLGDCIDPVTCHVRADAPAAPIIIKPCLRKPVKSPVAYFKPMREPTLRLLKLITDAPEGLTYQQIKDACGMNKDQIANILRRLECREEIRVDGECRRYVYKAVT